MSLVQVKRKAQITLPVKLRRALGIEEGDYLAARVEGNAIVLVPQTVIAKLPSATLSEQGDQMLQEPPPDVRAGRASGHQSAQSLAGESRDESDEGPRVPLSQRRRGETAGEGGTDRRQIETGADKPRLPIEIDQPALARFCGRNDIRKLWLFGSVLRDDFGPDSDVDVLVEFAAQARVGLLAMARMELELSEMLGRKVDLRTPEDLSRYFRDQVLATAVLQYAG